MKNYEELEYQIHVVAHAKCIQDPQYLKADEAFYKNFSKLRKILKRKRELNLLLELESAFYIKKGLFLEYAYLQGFEDGQVSQKNN